MYKLLTNDQTSHNEHPKCHFLLKVTRTPWRIPGLAQQMFPVFLEHLLILEKEEGTKHHWNQVKRIQEQI